MFTIERSMFDVLKVLLLVVGGELVVSICRVWFLDPTYLAFS
jgi:hypothetical protein